MAEAVCVLHNFSEVRSKRYSIGWNAAVTEYEIFPQPVPSPRDVDGRPLEWWKTRASHSYPGLVKVAQKYLSIPATQTRSDRLFSTAGNVVSSRRELLLTEHVEPLVFLHDNL
ncbi:hypothetical protein HPB47_015121 [Ixodes persulcatus]|uniref:Uncharacterized protein n=1 Tax=Ixodes persulcatus TaxID=34615 RepID=A0AC60QVJ7_IXOPE|nr:hypothetical protein HPB47_015121 [Ixodes persulcatus]